MEDPREYYREVLQVLSRIAVDKTQGHTLMGRLDGKVAIVTGAARGMGECHARFMVAEGAKVVLTDIAEEAGQRVADQLGENAIFVKQDVSRADHWSRVVEAAEARFGPVTVLVNNAGIVTQMKFDDTTEEILDQSLSVNAVGMFLGMKAVVPSMRRAGAGSIINISSIAGQKGSRNAFDYSVSKFAITGMTKSAATHLAASNIRVNSVHPGVIETPLLLTGGTDIREKFVQQMQQRIPMGRLGHPDEVSPIIVFLASDESSYCTGAEFTIDGGISCQSG